MTTTLAAPVPDAARTVFPDAVRLRRKLHRAPEIGLHLPRTQAVVLDALAGLGMEVRAGRSISSVTAVLRGGCPGPTVLLRADMDALPLHEDTGLECSSRVPGAAHACGHDTHVAMLLAAARLLAARRSELTGQVLFMFQPGEEGYHGARLMLDEGLLAAAGEPPSAAFALHIAPIFASGTINLREGPQLASSDVLRITVRGSGGHASMPHSANDPIPVACEIVTALQTMITRRTSVFDPAVLTISHLRSGTTYNVIPDSAYLEGTLRALSGPRRAELHGHIRRVAEGIAVAHEMSAEVEIELGYPTMVNDPAAATQVYDVAERLLGEENVVGMAEPLMAAEDFAYILERVPGAMAFLGACPPGTMPDRAAPNHSNRAVFDEKAMINGIGLYTAVALRHLNPYRGDRC
jgi:hippurate hydrolase